MLERSHNSI